MASFQDMAADRDHIRPGEARRTIEGIDALLCESGLASRRHRIGEGALEGDQLFPIDAQFSGDAVALHAARKIDRLGTSDQHFLGIAAP